jgi:hypothetical protein
MAERNIWVTCWRSEQLAIGSTSKSVYIRIPSHSKTRGIENDDDSSFCDIFNEKIAAMCNSITSGSVVFVAAGIIGKIFIGEAKKRGAVALDIGAMADYLAGRKTRASADII